MGQQQHLVNDVYTLFAMREPVETRRQAQAPENTFEKPSNILLPNELKLIGFSAGLGAMLTPFLVFGVSAFFQVGR